MWLFPPQRHVVCSQWITVLVIELLAWLLNCCVSLNKLTMSFRIYTHKTHKQTKNLLFLYFTENSLKIIQNSEEKDGARSPRTTPKSPHPWFSNRPQFQSVLSLPSFVSCWIQNLVFTKCNQSIKDLSTI